MVALADEEVANYDRQIRLWGVALGRGSAGLTVSGQRGRAQDRAVDWLCVPRLRNLLHTLRFPTRDPGIRNPPSPEWRGGYDRGGGIRKNSPAEPSEAW